MSSWAGLRTVIGISWRNLRRDRVALALSFVLPVIFFSIFASVFGNQGDATSRVRIAVVDEDGSELSGRIVDGRGKPMLRSQPIVDGDDDSAGAMRQPLAQRIVLLDAAD